MMAGDTRDFLQRVLIVFLVVVTALLLWRVAYIVLLVLAAGIFAVFVRTLARKLSDHAPVSASWAVALVVLLLLSLLGAFVWLFGSRIASDVAQLRQSLPAAIGQLEGWLEQYGWGRFLLQELPQPDTLIGKAGGFLSEVTGVFTAISNFLVAVLFIFIAGLFFAAEPTLYRDGLLKLLPASRRPRAREAIDAITYALWRWLLGQLVAMAVVGVSTAIGLWLLDVPLAAVLGLITALLNFIPFIGPIIAAVPALLLAFTQSPAGALYVLLLFLVIQQAEGYVLVPLVFEHAVSLPPVLTLAAVVAMGLLFGVLGALVAAPLLMIVILLVKMLYVQDVLGEPVKVPHRSPRGFPASDG